MKPATTLIEYVVPFSKEFIEEHGLVTGNRPDTTRVQLIIKTPIQKSDNSPEQVYASLEKFMDSVPVTSRAVVRDMSEPGLSIVNISHYREPLLRQIAKDNAVIKDHPGTYYRTKISCPENPVRWRMTGPLELAI